MSLGKRRAAAEPTDASATAARVKSEPQGQPLPLTALHNEADFADLRRHYFDPIVLCNVELPGGRVLREQTRPPRIDQQTPGFRALKACVRVLEKAGDRDEVFRLLRQLRDWERRPPSLGGALPACLRGEGGASADVSEVIAIADDDAQIIDADQFVREVLLVRVTAPTIKPDPDADPDADAADGTRRVAEIAAPVPFELGAIKPEPETKEAESTFVEMRSDEIPLALLRRKFVDQETVELLERRTLPSNIGDLGDTITELDMSWCSLTGARLTTR